MSTFSEYLPSAGVAITIFLLCSYVLSKIRGGGRSKIRSPPLAGGAWPIIGHLHLMAGAGNKLPHIALGELSDKHGPIFTIKLGMHQALVVSSSEVARECFTTHDLAISSRPKIVCSKHMSYDNAMMGFAPYGPYWREIRKIASIELLSHRRIELLKDVLASEVSSSITKLFKDSWNNVGRKVEMKQWFGDLSLNIILSMVAGKRFVDSEKDDKEKLRCHRVMRDFFRLLGEFPPGDSFPFIGWLDIGGKEKAMRETFKELDSLASGWLDEHRRRKSSGQSDGDNNLMSVMLELLQGTNLAGYNADTINKATSMNLIAGATDTTVVTLTWALSLVLNSPRVLKKAQEELDTQIGKNRLVSESDFSNLVYIQAILKETLRLHPPALLSGHRELCEDRIIAGYHVPKGTRLMVNLWKIHQDPSVWSDPEEFIPERFLTRHKDVDVRGHNYELLPFGTGRRACPGMSLGLQMLQLVLSNFLHAFDVVTPQGAPVDMSEIFGMTNVKATPLEVFVTPRLSPSAYG